MAAAQDQCQTIRALTNLDGRQFAGLSFRVGRNPYRLDILAGRGGPLPAPRECSFGIDPGLLDLSCTWVPEGYDANVQLFDSLLARFRQCLGDRVTPTTGPEPYGNATALRNSTSTFPTAGGETRLSLYLIEAPASPELASYHYIQLAVAFDPGATDGD